MTTVVANCALPGAPAMFADAWGIGREGRGRRAQALAVCRTCPLRLDCGRRALADFEGGLALYGVFCGVEFTDVLPSRQAKDVDRLRAVVARLEAR